MRLTDVPSCVLKEHVIPHLGDVNAVRLHLAFKRNNPATSSIVTRAGISDTTLYWLATALKNLKHVRGMRGMKHYVAYLQTLGIDARYTVKDISSTVGHYGRAVFVTMSVGKFKSHCHLYFFQWEEDGVPVNEIPASLDWQIVWSTTSPLIFPDINHNQEQHVKTPHLLLSFDRRGRATIKPTKFLARWTKIVERAFGRRRSPRTPKPAKRK